MAADQARLKLDLLRVRATLERTELRAAVLDLRRSTQPLGRVATAVFGAAQRLAAPRTGSLPLVATVFGLLRERPWLLSTLATVATRRGARRWLLLGGVAAVSAWVVRSLMARTKTGDAQGGDEQSG